MTAVEWLVAMLSLVALIYGATAVAYQFALRPGMAVAFVGYMIANVGLIWDALQQGIK